MNQLHDALTARLDAGRPVQFWLRDDDAIEPTSALNTLLAMAEHNAVPLTLACIPAFSGEALAERLLGEADVSVAVHGWSHQNHAPGHEKKQELGSHRPLTAVLDELSRGLDHLLTLHGDQFVPLLVPPWNRIDDSVVKQLASIAFQGLSTFGKPVWNDLPMINSTIDIIDWKGSRGGRETAELEAELLEQLTHSDGPIGLLTHHLVHDEKAWQFLEQLFEITSGHKAVSWVRIDELLPALRS